MPVHRSKTFWLIAKVHAVTCDSFYRHTRQTTGDKYGEKKVNISQTNVGQCYGILMF